MPSPGPPAGLVRSPLPTTGGPTVPLLDRMFARAYDRVMQVAEDDGLADQRARLLGDLAGTVVEVGAGTGLNLAHYPAAVDRVVACEPTPEMAEQLRARAAADPRVEVVDAPAEALPLPDDAADHAVATLVLCTVDDLARSTAELARVVRPGGRLALVEHVVADGRGAALLQRVVEPAWRVAARGCHLTRHPAASLERAGFDTSGLSAWRVPASAAVAAPAVVGTAVRR